MRDAKPWLDLALDPGWVERDGDLAAGNPLAFPGYDPGRETVVAASGASGGHPVEAVSFDFGILGGSMGIVAGEKVARAFERALGRRAAVVALCASGGARMQEGMTALVQMAKTVVSRETLARAGLPFVAYLRNPTTGGVYASFASLADVVWAEPGATVGFAGPRVAEAVTGRPLPDGSHTAAFAVEHGLIDAEVTPEALRAALRALIDLAGGRDTTAPVATVPEPKAPSPPDAWREVELARHPDRPDGIAFARRVASDPVEIHGDGRGADDAGVLCAFARIGGVRCGIVALGRAHPGPGGFRKAQRLIGLAGRWRLPVVSFVDTPGADPSSESEANGIARAIADTFAALLAHPQPVVAVVTGEGGSGGALALACADRLLILEHAIFSVIGPEAAATILRRDDAASVAADLRLTAFDLRRLGLADRVVAEPSPAAHADPDRAADAVGHAIALALAQIDPESAREARTRRWREAGNQFLS
ncbi:MAG TPA: carboxyl transferase domain-containing protein [Actinomycetota bacterium]